MLHIFIRSTTDRTPGFLPGPQQSPTRVTRHVLPYRRTNRGECLQYLSMPVSVENPLVHTPRVISYSSSVQADFLVP